MKAPILFLIFNRPDTTQSVLNSIKLYKPQKLYIASDGARANKENEDTIVENTRKLVLESIDWECEVKTLFRDKNLGCKYAVSSAIDWFFENEELGIILEDDCLPHASFFNYCEILLEKYKDNLKILSISGYNPIKNINSNNSYIFSKYFFSWGWASWKRAWLQNDIGFSQYLKLKKLKKLKTIYPFIYERFQRQIKIKKCLNSTFNSWAIPWNTTHQVKNAYSIIPSVNLIKNIGFSQEYSTHTKPNKWDSFFFDHDYNSINFPLQHPEIIKKTTSFETMFFKRDMLRVLLKKMRL